MIWIYATHYYCTLKALSLFLSRRLSIFVFIFPSIHFETMIVRYIPDDNRAAQYIYRTVCESVKFLLAVSRVYMTMDKSKVSNIM